MLELDIVLARFMERYFSELTVHGAEAFKRLLTCSDPDLWALIRGGHLGEDDEMARVILLLRQC